jgi:hypothetical protein
MLYLRRVILNKIWTFRDLIINKNLKEMIEKGSEKVIVKMNS